MDIQSKNVSFNISFIQDNCEIPVTTFYSNETELAHCNPSAVLVENIDLLIHFQCDDENSKLYMDGLESIPEMYVEEDDNGETFLRPSNYPIPLFKFEFYPLIPGFYRLLVETNNTKYFTLIQIKPKQLSVQQWEIMKDELESELAGLAQDLIRKNLGIGLPIGKYISSKLLHRFIVIQRNFGNVMEALSDLVNRVNHRIQKDYRLVEASQARVIDEVTIRYRLTHLENPNTYKIPVRLVEYDLPENQWIKRIVKIISRYLNEFSLAVETYNNVIEQEILDLLRYENTDNNQLVIREKRRVLSYLHSCLDISKKMTSAFRMIENTPWYSQIKDTHAPVSHVLLSDSRYRALYQLYRDLSSEEIEISIDSSYSYQWKRTDKLYEIWGFVQICKALIGEKLGFNVVKGWLFEANYEAGEILIPTLPSGTMVIFERGDIKLNLSYDSTLPLTSRQTNLDVTPLYVRGVNNRPDGRLDVFKNSTYIGSLLFDLKYRPLKGFWNTAKVRSCDRPKAMHQLIAYASHCKSIFLFGDQGQDYIKRDLNPVPEVWAIYPKDSYGDLIRFSEDHSVRLICLCPGESNGHLSDCLNNFLNDAIQRYESFCQRERLA